MKKLFVLMAAAFAMVACQTDINEVGVAGGEVDVTFEVGTPTRAYSDGQSATVLQYAVYEGTTELNALTVTDGEIHGSTTVSFKLVTGNTYTVIFWAAAPNAPYTVDFANKKMTVDYTAATTLSNDENRDAFYKRHTFTVTGAQTETIELRRPFAQLNIGTSDFEAAEKAGYTPNQSYVKVTKLGDVLNLWNDKVEGTDAVITFDYAAIPTTETFPVTGYEYLAMNYLLVDSEKEVVDIEFAYKETSTGDAKTRTVGSVPVQRNYRTNIYGQLLTSDVDINVVIKPEYYEPAHEADALYLAAAVGGEVTLTEDVVLSSALNVQSNMTINLNGHNITIDAAYDSVNYEASSAIVNNAVLTLTGNGEISATNNYTVRNNGTMVIDGVTIKNGVMNFGELTVESGNISNSRSGKHGIYGNAAKLTINGGTFHNDNAGNATIFAYGGEVVINGGEFTIADGTATFGWTSCLLDAQGSAKYTINGGVVMGEIRDYNKNTTVYGGVFGHSSVKNFLAAGYKAIEKDGLYYVVAEEIDAIVANAVELNKSVLAVTDGGVITITDDFNFTTEEGGYYNNGGWKDGLGYSGDKSFTIDLDGHTLGNANGALNDYLLWFKNDGEKANTITIKNGTLDAGTTAYCAIATSSSNKQTITINLENVTLINNNTNGAVAKIRAGAVLNVKAGTKIIGKNSYTGIECVASTVNIYEGAEIYQNGTSSSWGFLAGASWGGVLNVYGGKGVSARGGFMAMTSGGTVNVHGGEWIANVDGTIGNNSNLYVLSAQNNKYESGYKGASIVNVTGGTLRGGMDAWILNDANVEKAELNISGGNFNANPTSYLYDGATATENNGIWTVTK